MAQGRGPARAQEIMQELMCELMALTARPAARDANGVLGTLGPITGPLFTALDEKPYFLRLCRCDPGQHRYLNYYQAVPEGRPLPVTPPICKPFRRLFWLQFVE